MNATNLYGVAPHSGGPPRTHRPRTLPAGHQEQLSQPLLHQAGKALIVGLQGGAVHILDHCEERRKRTEEGFNRRSGRQRGAKEDTAEGMEDGLGTTT